MAIMNIRLCQIRISYSDEQGSNIYKTCTRELAHISACFYKYWYSANAEEREMHSISSSALRSNSYYYTNSQDMSIQTTLHQRPLIQQIRRYVILKLFSSCNTSIIIFFSQWTFHECSFPVRRRSHT